MTNHQDIYAVLEKLLEPASLPASWHRLPAPPDYRAPLRDFRAAVDLLRQSFADDDLVSAGVVRRSRSETGETTTSINPGLVMGNLLLLRRDPGEPHYEIVSAAGCISGSEPPLLAALHDAATQRLLESFGDTLFATFTIEDAAILRGLGIPAMPAAGLQKLHGRHFEEFCAALDVRPLGGDPWEAEEEEDEEEESTDDTGLDGDHPSAASPPPVTPASSPISPPDLQPGKSATEAASPHPKSSAARGQPAPPPSAAPRQATVPKDIRLCFAAWELAQLSLDEPEKLSPIDAHLRELAGHLDLLMDQIFVWRPAPNLPQKLRCALYNNLPKHVRRIVTSSCDHSKRALILPDRAPPSQPLTIREAWEPLQEGGERQGDHAANIQVYNQMIYREVTAPYLEKAEALTDPAEKARALVEAHCASQELRLLPQLGLGAKAPRPASNGLLRPDDADVFRAAQKQRSAFLDASNPARKKSSR